MTKEELIKLSRENLRKSKQGSLCECYDEAFIKGYELSEKQIAELEKENAELKLKLEALEGQTPWKDIKDKSEVIGQLAKAKDILRRLMENQPTPSSMYEEADLVGWRDVNKEAEQFFNSEVEK